MNFFYLLLGGLATYRLSLLVSKEDGPAYLFRKIRRVPRPNSSAKEGLSCEWCMSIWVSALVTTFFWWRGLIVDIDWPLYWLAMSAIAVICNQQWTKTPNKPERPNELQGARSNISGSPTASPK